MTRMAELLKTKNTPPIFKDITGSEAAKLIVTSPSESPDVVGFDLVEASRLNVTYNALVSIAPNDTGTYHIVFLSRPLLYHLWVYIIGRTFPTIGNLVGLNREEFLIEIVTNPEPSVVRCHFPRIGFTIENVSSGKGKL